VDLQSVLGTDLFGDDDKVGSELDSVIAGLERHGFPMEQKQVKALAYAGILCPESQIIAELSVKLDAGRYKSIDPGLFLEALDKYTLANRVTGRIPLSKAFNGGGKE